jgi:hypothetical protein
MGSAVEVLFQPVVWLDLGMATPAVTATALSHGFPVDGT